MHDTTSSRLTINNLWRQGSSDNLRSGSTSIFRRLIAASDQRRASLVHFFPFHSSKRSSSWVSIPRSLVLVNFFSIEGKRSDSILSNSRFPDRVKNWKYRDGRRKLVRMEKKGKTCTRISRAQNDFNYKYIYILYIHDDCTLLRNPARVIHNCFNTYLRSFAFHRNLLFSAQYYIRIFASRPSTAVHRLCARRRNYIDNVVPFPHLPTY